MTKVKFHQTGVRSFREMNSHYHLNFQADVMKTPPSLVQNKMLFLLLSLLTFLEEARNISPY